mmetsp:Transcript_29278/g.62232  ORF Transcript_29278/g.62232 Transcript_29278/m.62232 type:complete len:207 (+) Transcript_29278:142-762(+)
MSSASCFASTRLVEMMLLFATRLRSSARRSSRFAIAFFRSPSEMSSIGSPGTISCTTVPANCNGVLVLSALLPGSLVVFASLTSFTSALLFFWRKAGGSADFKSSGGKSAPNSSAQYVCILLHLWKGGEPRTSQPLFTAVTCGKPPVRVMTFESTIPLSLSSFCTHSRWGNACGTGSSACFAPCIAMALNMCNMFTTVACSRIVLL